MSSPCSDLGLCVDGECKCYHGFTGTNCSTECSGGAYNPCTLNGDCQMDGSCRCVRARVRVCVHACVCECVRACIFLRILICSVHEYMYE